MKESGGREREKDAVYKLCTKRGHEGNRKRRKEEQGQFAVIEHVNSQSSKAKHGGETRLRSRAVRTMCDVLERDGDRKKTVGYRVDGRWSV